MAQKYIVQEKDNPLTLAKKFETSPQAILQNNAIKSLTAGQTIKIPTSGGVSGDKQGQLGTAKTNGPFVVNTNPLFNQTQTQAQGSFVSGGGQVNLQGQQNRPPVGSIPSNVTNGGYLTQNGQYTSTQQQSNIHTQVPIFGQVTSTQLTGGSFYSGSGEINLTGVVPGGGSVGGSNNSYSRPTGIYTGGNSANDIAWRNYWNYSAANPSSVEAPASTYMPTRNDIWERKAAQRRRENGGGNNGYSYQQPVYTPPTQIGNNVVGGSWRVG